jgi:hypothetical protein
MTPEQVCDADIGLDAIAHPIGNTGIRQPIGIEIDQVVGRAVAAVPVATNIA